MRRLVCFVTNSMRRPALVFLSCVVLMALAAQPVFAHQPFFEDVDSTPTNPFKINDASISLALYATLESNTDVDYFTFSAKKDQRIPVSIVIPQIKGQEKFAPMLAVVGPGLPTISGTLPAAVPISKTNGVLVIAPPTKAGEFYEPFGGDKYWTRQGATFSVPKDGKYMIVVWDAQGCVGRYTLSVGSKEIFGGDPNYRTKKKAYWTAITNTVAACR